MIIDMHTHVHPPAIRCVVESIGADAPPLPPLKPKGLQLVRDLGLAAADEAMVLGGNAARLFRLA